MFRKAKGSNIREDKTVNDQVLGKQFSEDFVHMTVARVCKLASMSAEGPMKCVDLGYEYPIMQTLIVEDHFSWS